MSEMVLKELETMPKGEDQWGAKMTVFQELVEHHIKDEQSKVFKSAEKALSSEEFQQIRKQFEQEKQAIKKNLGMTTGNPVRERPAGASIPA